MSQGVLHNNKDVYGIISLHRDVLYVGMNVSVPDEDAISIHTLSTVNTYISLQTCVFYSYGQDQTGKTIH